MEDFTPCIDSEAASRNGLWVWGVSASSGKPETLLASEMLHMEALKVPSPQRNKRKNNNNKASVNKLSYCHKQAQTTKQAEMWWKRPHKEEIHNIFANQSQAGKNF